MDPRTSAPSFVWELDFSVSEGYNKNMTLRYRTSILFLLFIWLISLLPAQEVRRRWETMNQIRRDKFDLILPEVMRANQIDMWITMVKEGLPDPLVPDLGEGYVGSIGYYIFTDRGADRIERVALGISGYLLEQGGAYDSVTSDFDLQEFVGERNPRRIGINTSHHIGAADGLSHSGFEHLTRELGDYADRLVSAEKLVSDFRSRRVASEIAVFTRAGELSKRIAEQAFSNQVITPGITTLEDVAWWMKDQLFQENLGSSFGMPSVYVTGPEGIAAVSTDRIIRRGDLLMIDWGVGLMNFHTDMKRIAYVLKGGEDRPPAGIVQAFEKGLAARKVVRQTIRSGVTAAQALEEVNRALRQAGFAIMENFNQPSQDNSTEVIVGCHSVGNLGHGIGPSIAWFNPRRLTFEIRPTNLLSIELFAYTAAPEWGGKKVRIPLEDDAIVTERGIEWLYPINQRILLIK